MRNNTKNLMDTLHFCASMHKQSLRNQANVASGNGLALLVTEFGATPSDGGVDQCTDTSCILTSDAPADGPWTDNVDLGSR
jgi:hypothetical protein